MVLTDGVLPGSGERWSVTSVVLTDGVLVTSVVLTGWCYLGGADRLECYLGGAERRSVTSVVLTGRVLPRWC